MFFIGQSREQVCSVLSMAVAKFHHLLVSANTHPTLKRMFDLSGAMILTVIAAPLMGLIFFIIYAHGQNPIFRHKRIGMTGQPFNCFKFRTMVDDAESMLERHLSNNSVAKAEWVEHNKLVNDPRVTRIGRFLRKTSLDELPQLINVLRGDMSLVGPRPVTQEELTRYGAAITYYVSIRPGLTGLWQVSGRNAISYNQRVILDTYYATNANLLLDMKILSQTAMIVLIGRGAY